MQAAHSCLLKLHRRECIALGQVSVFDTINSTGHYARRVRRLGEFHFQLAKVMEPDGQDIDDPLYGNPGGQTEKVLTSSASHGLLLGYLPAIGLSEVECSCTYGAVERPSQFADVTSLHLKDTCCKAFSQCSKL